MAVFAAPMAMRRRSSPATRVYTDSGFSNANTATFTFSGRNLGTAAANRKMVVVINGNADNRTVSSVTVGGVSATLATDGVTSARSQNLDGTTEIWQADVPTGTTGDVVITWSGAQNTCGFGLFAVYGGSAAATEVATSAANPPSASITAPSGGVIIGGAQHYNGAQTWTWTNLTEAYDSTMGGSRPQTGASDAFATAQTPTITCMPSGTPAGQTMVLVAFGPA